METTNKNFLLNVGCLFLCIVNCWLYKNNLIIVFFMNMFVQYVAQIYINETPFNKKVCLFMIAMVGLQTIATYMSLQNGMYSNEYILFIKGYASIAISSYCEQIRK